MTHRPYTPPAWQSKPLADGRVTLLVVPIQTADHVTKGPNLFNGKWSDDFVLDPGNESWRQTYLPYAPGDLIWCREAFITGFETDDDGFRVGDQKIWYRATDAGLTWYDDDSESTLDNPPWRSPVTMPKWAVRTWLRCTGVEARRVQTISEDEAHSAGYEFTGMSPTGDDYLGSAICGPWGFAEGFPNYYADPWCAFVAVEKISKEDV